ncbi:MAG: citrate synthase, partial [Anaerolineae bacterium]
LILCADHELNVSSFTARCVASAGSTPYQVVQAGLAALQGVKHGRMADRVEAFLREAGSPAGVQAAIASYLRRGEAIPGFGHPLYPSGDPRGRMLLAQTATAYPDSAAVALSQAVAGAVFELIGEYPTVDFGLVTLAQALHLPPGGAITLFALGRAIGWIGHAIEQYQLDRIIRPRAQYIGRQPVEF